MREDEGVDGAVGQVCGHRQLEDGEKFGGAGTEGGEAEDVVVG